VEIASCHEHHASHYDGEGLLSPTQLSTQPTSTMLFVIAATYAVGAIGAQRGLVGPIVPFHGVDCCGGDEDSQRGNRPLRKTVAPPIIWEASWWKRPRVAKRYPFARPHPPGTHHTAGFSRRSPPRPSKSPTDAPYGCCGSCPGSATEETPSRAPPVAALNNVTELLRE
jgi:hypothetical protein